MPYASHSVYDRTPTALSYPGYIYEVLRLGSSGRRGLAMESAKQQGWTFPPPHVSFLAAGA